MILIVCNLYKRDRLPLRTLAPLILFTFIAFENRISYNEITTHTLIYKANIINTDAQNALRSDSNSKTSSCYQQDLFIIIFFGRRIYSSTIIIIYSVYLLQLTIPPNDDGAKLPAVI